MARRFGFLFEAAWVLRGALVVVACFSFFHAVAYSPVFEPEDLPMAVQLVSTFVPLWVWSGLWLLAAVVALACVPRAWPAGSVGCVLLCFVWATGYAVSWSQTIEGVHVVWFHHLPLVTFLTDRMPNERDYFRSSIYWTVLLLLGAGYVLARKALDAQNHQPPIES